MRHALALSITLVTVAGVAFAQAPERRHYRLEISLPEGCAESFSEALLAKTKTIELAKFGETAPASLLRVHVTKNSGPRSTFAGTLDIETSGAPVRRELEGESCAEVLRGLAFVAAVTIDPPSAPGAPDAADASEDSSPENDGMSVAIPSAIAPLSEAGAEADAAPAPNRAPIAVAVGTVAATAPLVLRSTAPAAPSVAVAPPTTTTKRPVESPPILSTPETVSIASLPDAPAPASAPVPRFGGARAASPAIRLGDELPHLEDARAKLSAGDYAGTHAALDAYARAFEKGALAPEAAALRVDAFAAAGDRARAMSAARAYLSRYPTGAAAPRMRDLISSAARDQNVPPAP